VYAKVSASLFFMVIMGPSKKLIAKVDFEVCGCSPQQMNGNHHKCNTRTPLPFH
jgi:hypothetical protein